MKHIAIIIFLLFHLSLLGKQSEVSDRETEIEGYMAQVYSVNEFRAVASYFQLTLDELCDYPVIFPLRKPRRISSEFGMRKHPLYKEQMFHTGIDFPEPLGTPVYATGNGVVIRKGYDSGYGYFVEIEHKGGFRSFYAHLNHIRVDVGDTVTIAQQIASVGNSGVATGNHLHYEIRKGKRYLNPMGWYRLLVKNV